jgi:2'-5' RNA ligase
MTVPMTHLHPEDTDRIVIEALIHHECAHLIFQNLIDGAPLAKIKSPETYHITLGFIHSIHNSDTMMLKDFLQDFIDHQINPVDIAQKIFKAGQFQGNDAIVLFFENPNKLRTLSKTIRQHLMKFRGIDPYDFSQHSQPQNYRPHLTVGDGTRRSIIVINDRIRSSISTYKAQITEVQARIIPR